MPSAHWLIVNLSVRYSFASFMCASVQQDVLFKNYRLNYCVWLKTKQGVLQHTDALIWSKTEKSKCRVFTQRLHNEALNLATKNKILIYMIMADFGEKQTFSWNWIESKYFNIKAQHLFCKRIFLQRANKIVVKCKKSGILLSKVKYKYVPINSIPWMSMQREPSCQD